MRLPVLTWIVIYLRTTIPVFRLKFFEFFEERGRTVTPHPRVCIICINIYTTIVAKRKLSNTEHHCFQDVASEESTTLLILNNSHL
jgi:hypothetical protein